MAGDFYYTGTKHLKEERGKRPNWCRFRIFFKDTDELVLEIITNKDLKGRFIETDSGMMQTFGNPNFTLPGSDVGVRKLLRSEAKKAIECWLDSHAVGFNATAEEMNAKLDVFEALCKAK